MAPVLSWGINLTGALARYSSAIGPNYLVASPKVYGNGYIQWEIGQDLPTVALAKYFLGPRPHVSYREHVTQAPSQVEMRPTIRGRFPGLQSLSYRLMASVALNHTGVYVEPDRVIVGQTTSSMSPLPVERLVVMAGLQYDLGQ